MILRQNKSALPFLLGLAFLPYAIPAWAQQSNETAPPAAAAPAPASRSNAHSDAPVVKAARLDAEITIDGRLDERGWQRTTPARGAFTQIQPSEGDPSPEKTDVYVLYDDDAVYIGARMWDASGDISQRLGRRDSRAQDSDWFSVALDSYHDHLRAFQFSLNPAGVKRDEITNGGFRGDDSWDVIWDGAASVDGEGWSAEIRVPFSQLRFSSASVQSWGIQFTRSINRLQETSVFVFTPRSERGGVARYGHLSGLTDLKAGKRLEVVPYALGRGLFVQGTGGDPFRDGSEFQRGYGLDALYRVTTSMTLTGTVNPDFGQVEVDPAVINLNAFETSFQENRPFFVEGGDLFRFGSAGAGGGFRGGPGGGGRGRGGGGGGGFGGGAPDLLYSRRIGRAPQGSTPDEALFSDAAETATILGAAKLTGRTADGWSVGLLDAITGEESARWVAADDTRGATLVEPRTNYFTGRVIRSLGSGQTQLGAIGTAVHRSLGDPALVSRLHSSAYTGGLDFSHEFLRRTWAVEAFFAFSQVSGSTDAMTRTQRLSSRYYQRPDAGHVEVDSSLTVLRGYSSRIEIAKRAGLHWTGEANVYATSPGFEINDLGFQTGVDRVGTQLNLNYSQNTPQGWFRNYRIGTGPNFNWNHDGDFVGGRLGMGMNGQFKNFWGAGLNFNRRLAGYDDRLTRGGPLARGLPSQSVGLNVRSDNRRRLAGFLFANYSWGKSEGTDRRIGGNIQIRPVDNWTISLGPNVSTGLTHTQYVTAVTDPTATFGRRYIFTELARTQISMETRLNVTFTPELSLELFMQPLISSGDYGTLSELHTAGKYGFDRYGVEKGTVTYDAAGDEYTIDPDGSGSAASFTIANKDFNTRSLRGNAVLRWEYRPGSTLFLVWQQRRSETESLGDFDFGHDARSIFNAPADNVFVIKFDYWLNL